MMSEEEARNGLLQTIRPLPARKVPLAKALGCFAAQDYAARIPLPIFDNSAMDGYAVIASDCSPRRIRPPADRSSARLRVVGEQAAGMDRHLHLRAGQAIRIFTGAPIPEGADAVVLQEDVARHGDEIVVNVDVDPGEFIRKRACDLSEGQKILGKGEPIRATTVALFASQGITELSVGGEASAAIISTGDELAKIGEPLQPGQIYESNSVLLQALAERCGASVASVVHCRDERDSLIDAIKKGSKHSVLMITGGVSVGEHDLVRTALQSLGARIDIWRVAIKPGKPFLFGRLKQRRPSPQSSPSGRGGREAPGEGSFLAGTDCFVFGLPGNPVSAFVTFLVFVRPAILKMMGATNLNLRASPAKLSVDLKNESDRSYYIRGQFENGEFSPTGRQESHALFGLSRANGVVRLGPGEGLGAGATVTVEMWD